jgi:hypothetical protein
LGATDARNSPAAVHLSQLSSCLLGAEGGAGQEWTYSLSEVRGAIPAQAPADEAPRAGTEAGQGLGGGIWQASLVAPGECRHITLFRECTSHPAANVRNTTVRAHILLLEMHSAVTPFRKRRSGPSFHLNRPAPPIRPSRTCCCSTRGEATQRHPVQGGTTWPR